MGMGVPPLVVPQNSNGFFGTSGDRTWQPSSALGQCPINSHVIFLFLILLYRVILCINLGLFLIAGLPIIIVIVS